VHESEMCSLSYWICGSGPQLGVFESLSLSRLRSVYTCAGVRSPSYSHPGAGVRVPQKLELPVSMARADVQSILRNFRMLQSF